MARAMTKRRATRPARRVGATFALALALAVLETHVDAAEAFRLSRLEEESQAEAWGRDADSDGRAARLKGGIMAAARLLGLLNAA